MSRAGDPAFAAANAWQCRPARTNVLVGGDKQAVRCLDDRDIRRSERKAHHGPAHDEVAGVVRVPAAGLDDVGYRGTEADLQVTGPRHAMAGYGDDPGYQRFAGKHRSGHGRRGAHILDKVADIGRYAVGGDLLSGEYLDELLLAAFG